jgi:hypothetical protein
MQRLRQPILLGVEGPTLGSSAFVMAVNPARLRAAIARATSIVVAPEFNRMISTSFTSAAAAWRFGPFLRGECSP